MALIRTGFFSEVLGMCANCDVILPQLPDANAPVRRFPVMVLLHGIMRSHSAWQRFTRIEEYAVSRGVAVIMPDGQNSSYADMLHGGKYFSYIADELLPVMRGFFPLSDRREDTYICGASMGGYGALKIALNRPEVFGVAGSLSSGYTSYRGYISRKDDRGLSLQWLTFGETGLDEEDADTAEKARAIAESGVNVPRIFITCGSEDPILLENAREGRDFFSSFEGDPFDFQYTELPGGHDWTFWDGHICDFLTYAGRVPGERLC